MQTTELIVYLEVPFVIINPKRTVYVQASNKLYFLSNYVNIKNKTIHYDFKVGRQWWRTLCHLYSNHWVYNNFHFSTWKLIKNLKKFFFSFYESDRWSSNAWAFSRIAVRDADRYHVLESFVKNNSNEEWCVCMCAVCGC